MVKSVLALVGACFLLVQGSKSMYSFMKRKARREMAEELLKEHLSKTAAAQPTS